MFEGIFGALKRFWDLTAVPTLVAMLLYVVEKLFGLVGWIFVVVGDFLVSIVTGLLSFLPIPESMTISDSTFGSKFLDLAQLIGLWPACLAYFSFAIVALIARIVTLGIVGNR